MKKGVNGHNPQLPGAERVQGRAESGPRMRSTTMSLLMTVNLSESGSFSRCSAPLAALLPPALAVGLPARSTHTTGRKNTNNTKKDRIHHVARQEKGQLIRRLETRFQEIALGNIFDSVYQLC